jgi:N-methylhydantoinase A/oxoprolinase/acetone carboxylase beta subunit
LSAQRPDLRLGVDVGGTNTDAVILDGLDRLVATAKVTTTPDVTRGIREAIGAVINGSATDGERITHVMLGTTHATNAILQRTGLQRVAVIRIGAPASLAIPPLASWPLDLHAAVSAGEIVVHGGTDFGGREIAPLDRDAIARFLAPLGGKVDAVAIVSVFAIVSPEHELAAASIARETLGDAQLSLSHEIGSVGLIERENATVLNAALGGIARSVASSLAEALSQHSLRPVVSFAQNDGTLMALHYALQHPVLTIGSGPANSIRGAAHLSGLDEGLVVDVGGTSTDVGAISNGFPRESTTPFQIGGVTTNFRMPDLTNLRLGGGTLLQLDGRDTFLGSESVGFRLSDAALVFGGGTPTLSDAAVAAGRAKLGDPDLLPKDKRRLVKALTQAERLLEDTVDQMKLSRASQPLIAVGGASFLVPDRLPGISELCRPQHAEVANAIGAALAHVSGQVERIFNFSSKPRADAIAEASWEARTQAILGGADPDRTEIVEIEEVPLAYLTAPAVRVRAKAAGPLAAF